LVTLLEKAFRLPVAISPASKCDGNSRRLWMGRIAVRAAEEIDIL
jgi:hypothetical protein